MREFLHMRDVFPNSRRLSNSIRSAGGQCCLFDKMQDLSKKILTITEKYRKNRKLLESVFYHLLAWQLDILKIF